MSEKCKLFEEMFSDFINSNESIFLNSGSSADLLAMTTLVKSPEFDIHKGDKGSCSCNNLAYTSMVNITSWANSCSL